MKKPTALAHYAIYETVERILKDQKRGRLLDIPAGEGALAVRLQSLGFEVNCCDLYPEIFRLDGTEVRAGNLDSELPYEDQSFDFIVCVEGLEHIENPSNAIREFARISRPSGRLIVTVPNIMNIEERLKWLFNGYTSHFKPLSADALRDHKYHEMGGMDEIALHINPIGYSEVRYLLEKNHFELQQVFPDKPKKNTWMFLPLVALITFVSRLGAKTKRVSRWAKELNSREVLRGGNTLIFLAKKV